MVPADSLDQRKPWTLTSGGPGGGLYVSRDGGDTWKQLGGGPGLALSPPGRGADLPL
jgi:hypothetical protein